MIKKLKEKIVLAGLDPKKELIGFLVVNATLLLAGALLLIFLKDILYFALCFGLMFVFSLVYLTRYSKRIAARNSENLQDFATLFGYFRIYIHNGYSVYSALKELLNFANPDLEKSIRTLINEIDEDKTVQPFINFSKQFNEIIIEELMISIYQLIDDGESSDYLMQFELIFDKFSEILYEKYLKSKDSKLATLSSAPLIGSCFLIVVLTVGIISIIGDLINGI